MAALRLSDRVVAETAERLHEGGWSYSPNQLYYACCRAVERPELSVGNGQMGCGVLLLLVGIIAGGLATLYLAVCALIGIVLIGLGIWTRQQERDKPTTRPLVVSFIDFSLQYVAPRRTGVAPKLPGLLLDVSADADHTVAEPSAVVVCDREETAAMLRANLATAGLSARVVLEGAAMAGLVHVVHDASRDGCELALRLRERGLEVVDLGLRPRQLQGPAQIIESAPMVIAPEMGSVLTDDEVAWLAGGKRVELAVAEPAALMANIVRALAAPSLPGPGGDGQVGVTSVSLLEPVAADGEGVGATAAAATAAG